MFLSGSAETVMSLLLRFRTRTNSALPLQRDVSAPVKKNCLGDMSPHVSILQRRHVALTNELFFGTAMLNRASEPESQETQNRKLNWIYDICMQNCIVVCMDHDNSGTTDVVRCHFDAFSTQRPLIAIERPSNGSLLCMAKICRGVWSLLNIPKLILKTTLSPIVIGN